MNQSPERTGMMTESGSKLKSELVEECFVCEPLSQIRKSRKDFLLCNSFLIQNLYIK